MNRKLYKCANMNGETFWVVAEDIGAALGLAIEASQKAKPARSPRDREICSIVKHADNVGMVPA